MELKLSVTPAECELLGQVFCMFNFHPELYEELDLEEIYILVTLDFYERKYKEISLGKLKKVKLKRSELVALKKVMEFLPLSPIGSSNIIRNELLDKLQRLSVCL